MRVSLHLIGEEGEDNIQGHMLAGGQMWLLWEPVIVIFFSQWLRSNVMDWEQGCWVGAEGKVWEDRSYKTDIEEIRSMKEIDKC